MKNKFFNLAKNKDGSADLLVFGIIGYDVEAKELLQQILDLKRDGVSKLNVYLDSPGGSIFAGVSIYNAIKSMDATVYVYGLAASMGSVIALAGKKVIMTPQSYMMIHNPWTISWGESKDLQKDVDLLDKLKDTIISVYQDRAKVDNDELKTMMDNETWMNSEKALDLGFCDKVVKADTIVNEADGFVNLVARALQDKFKTNFRNINTEDNIMLSKENLEFLGLDENATDEQINDAIANLQSASEPAPDPDPDSTNDRAGNKELQRLRGLIEKMEAKDAAAHKQTIVAVLDDAVDRYKILKADRQVWEQALIADFAKTKERLDAITAGAVKPAQVGIDDDKKLTFQSGTMSLINAAASAFKAQGRK